MEDRCICCDEIIPEGRQVCFKCEHDINKEIKETNKEVKEIDNNKVSLITYIVNKYFKEVKK